MFLTDEQLGALEEIKECTEYNNVNEAYILACQYLIKYTKANADNLLKIFKHIQGIQDLSSGMPPELIDYRHRIYNDMLKLAKTKLSEAHYKKFYHCF